MSSGVHGEATSSSSEAVSLGAILATITLLAEDISGMFRHTSGIHLLVAEAAFEARSVPLISSREHLLGGIHRLAAFGAFGLFSWRERHCAI